LETCQIQSRIGPAKIQRGSRGRRAGGPTAWPDFSLSVHRRSPAVGIFSPFGCLAWFAVQNQRSDSMLNTQFPGFLISLFGSSLSVCQRFSIYWCQAAARGRFADFSALGHRRLPHVLHEPLTTDYGRRTSKTLKH